MGNKVEQCQINFDGNGWANVLTVISPTGNSISFTTNGKSKYMSDTLITKMGHIHKIWKDGSGTDCGIMGFTHSEMAEIKELGELR